MRISWNQRSGDRPRAPPVERRLKDSLDQQSGLPMRTAPLVLEKWPSSRCMVVPALPRPPTLRVELISICVEGLLL